MENRIEELRVELQEEENILDPVDEESAAEAEQQNYPLQFSISSYGADYDVRGLVQRLNEKTITIPSFQRNFVWNIVDASKFIESLLLGLPVPGVFMAKETGTQNLLVIDGQQRLKSLQFFYNGVFNPKDGDSTARIFRLKGVNAKFNGIKYLDLDSESKNILDNSIIHATVIKQDSPKDDDTSIYYVFERINSGGRILTPQEIRTAAFHGNLTRLLGTLNRNASWRKIYGKPNSRLKDQELILRFFALYFNRSKYKKPLKSFINNYCLQNKNIDEKKAEQLTSLFSNTIKSVYDVLGDRAFRPENALNAAVFDSIMIATAERLEKDKIDPKKFASAYSNVLADQDYKKHITQSTSDENAVLSRIQIASRYFSSI